MGLYLQEPGEPVFCIHCGKCILGPRVLIAKTADGNPICPKCIDLFQLTDVSVPQLDFPRS